MWKSQWFHLSMRIGSLMDAARFLVGSLTERLGDRYAANAEVSRNAQAIIEELKIFQKQVGLPGHARDRLGAFLELYDNEKERIKENNFGQMQWLVTVLAALRSELDYVLSDFETVTRNIVNGAFEHLKRCIRADDDFARKWQAAFEKKQEAETACEKLGAVHLLHRGIWAFKAHGRGSRTDLILGTPIGDENIPEIERASNALVLTEWKRVREGELQSKAEEAYKQALDYGESLLAGFELASRRYLELFSKL